MNIIIFDNEYNPKVISFVIEAITLLLLVQFFAL